MVSRPLFGFGLGLTVISLDLGFGLMKYWSRSRYVLVSLSRIGHLLTVFCVLLILISAHYEYYTTEEMVIVNVIYYSSFIISNM